METRPIGTVRYVDLDKDTRHDVAESVSRKLGVSEPEAARILKEMGELTLIAVPPKDIWPELGHPLDGERVEKYADAMEEGEDFPPIIIDSSDRKPLVEGFHRTAAAMEVDLEEVAAIDIAEVSS